LNSLLRAWTRALAVCAGLGAAWLVLASPASANDLDDIRANKKLVWAADQEGGGPFIYPSDDDPDVLLGFEVDMAEKLAQYLGAEDVFAQGAWDTLLDLVQADKAQIALNGYEWSAERADKFEASIPYYVYALQLMARKGDARIAAWDDLKKPKPEGGKWQVGVLGGSASEEVAAEHCGETTCEVIPYDGNTDAMRDVEIERLDATLQDTPIAAFYGKDFPGLHYVDKPVAPGYYSIFVKKGETELIRQLNEAIVLMIRSGDLERIYRKYGIWDELNEQLLEFAENAKYWGYLKASMAEVEKVEMPDEAAVADVSTRKEGWEIVTTYLPTLVQAAGMTILLSVVSFPLAIGIGVLVALGRLYGPGWLRAPLTAYVEFLRGTPLMLQLYFIFFVLPEVGINVPALATAILGLAINYSAYESEIYRAGLQAIPPGQMEAALSLGLTRAQAIRTVVLPQAFRIVIPPVVNDFIALFKDTSVCSVITVIELTKQFSILSKSTLAILEMMGLTALLYLAMSYPLSLAARYVEKRLGNTGAIA
jgi:polar amino acid transport system substrate-binding protein